MYAGVIVCSRPCVAEDGVLVVHWQLLACVWAVSILPVACKVLHLLVCLGHRA